MPERWTKTHANKRANGPKVKAQKEALYPHQQGHSWHGLDKPKQNFNMQKGTPNPPNMAAKVAPKRCMHQGSYVGIKGHTLKA